MDNKRQPQQRCGSPLPRRLLWAGPLRTSPSVQEPVPPARLQLHLQLGLRRSLLPRPPAVPSAKRQIQLRQRHPAAGRLDVLSGHVPGLDVQQLVLQQLLVNVVVPSRQHQPGRLRCGWKPPCFYPACMSLLAARSHLPQTLTPCCLKPSSPCHNTTSYPPQSWQPYKNPLIYNPMYLSSPQQAISWWSQAPCTWTRWATSSSSQKQALCGTPHPV